MPNIIQREDFVDPTVGNYQIGFDGQGNQLPYYEGFIQSGYKRMFEAKSEQVGDPRNRKVWKNFEHYKVIEAKPNTGLDQVKISVDQNTSNGIFPVFTVSGLGVLYADEYGSRGALNKGLPVWYTPQERRFVPDPGGLGSLVNASLRSMLPLIKAELSIINSLLELKDFKSLPNTIKSVLKLAAIAPKNIRGNNKRRFIREIIRSSADVYLQWKFNIGPLISDICGIYRALSRVERRLNDLISRSGGVKVKHYELHLLESETSSREEVAGNQASWTGPVWATQHPIYMQIRSERYVQTDPAIFHAQIQYNYNYTEYQREHARILGLLDALGINLNPAIVWNAIPWSFVADWVVGVSRWLNDNRLGNMDPKINILQYLWSIKRKRRIFVQRRIRRQMIYGNNTYFGPWDTYTMPAVTETAYRRECFLPTGYSLTTSGLSSTEFSLGAALVLSRGRRHKRTRSR